MTKLKPCPCGQIPKKLIIHPDTLRFACVSGSCCAKWMVKVWIDRIYPDSKECYDLAVKAWNMAERDK